MYNDHPTCKKLRICRCKMAWLPSQLSTICPRWRNRTSASSSANASCACMLSIRCDLRASNHRGNYVHTEEFFRNLIKSTRNQIVFTIFRLIWNQTDVRLVINQSENGKYNLISVWYNKISKKYICVCSVKRASSTPNTSDFLTELWQRHQVRWLPVVT